MTEPTENGTDSKIVMLGRCPNCSQRAVLAFRPFCSKRCADVDQSRWMSGGYAIPAVEIDDGDIEAIDALSDPPDRN